MAFQALLDEVDARSRTRREVVEWINDQYDTLNSIAISRGHFNWREAEREIMYLKRVLYAAYIARWHDHQYSININPYGLRASRYFGMAANENWVRDSADQIAAELHRRGEPSAEQIAMEIRRAKIAATKAGAEAARAIEAAHVADETYARAEQDAAHAGEAAARAREHATRANAQHLTALAERATVLAKYKPSLARAATILAHAPKRAADADPQDPKRNRLA